VIDDEAIHGCFRGVESKTELVLGGLRDARNADANIGITGYYRKRS
jgi:hypothetical protein